MIDYLTLIDRDKGALPLSLGTSQAFESPEVQHYPTVLINVRTLLRNLYASVRRYPPEDLSIESVFYILDDEIQTLRTTFPNTHFLPYHCAYNDLNGLYPGRMAPKRQGTKKDILILIEESMSREYAKARKGYIYTQASADMQFPVKGKALLFSHLVSDLFCHYHFKQLDLLESYSGKVKPRDAWYTKLANCAKYPTIPFNRFTLMLYGDGGILFTPHTLGLRRIFAQLSVNKAWTQRTTMEAIREAIDRMDRQQPDYDRITLRNLAGPFS